MNFNIQVVRDGLVILEAHRDQINERLMRYLEENRPSLTPLVTKHFQDLQLWSLIQNHATQFDSYESFNVQTKTDTLESLSPLDFTHLGDGFREACASALGPQWTGELSWHWSKCYRDAVTHLQKRANPRERKNNQRAA